MRPTKKTQKVIDDLEKLETSERKLIEWLEKKSVDEEDRNSIKKLTDILDKLAQINK